jgi:paraquat-inducible protein A
MQSLAAPTTVLRECPLCGLFQSVPEIGHGMRAQCGRCGTTLRSHRTDPEGRALALAMAGLAMFGLAVSLPFMELDLRGRGAATHLAAGPEALREQGMGAVALVVLATTVLAPLAKLLCLIWVLVGLRLKRRLPHTVLAFRWAEELGTWSMIEVFLLGVFVAYTKLSDLAPVHMGAAAYALGALMLAMAAADAALDHQAIWHRLEPAGLQHRCAAGPGPLIGCDDCGQVSRALHTCPRCGGELRHRKPHSLQRSWALLIAAAVLYVPANTLPVLTSIQLGRGQPDTILSGVEELGATGQWPLAALVFVASITVPVLKLVGLGWLLISTQLGLRAGLGERTQLYRIVEAVGRWSMVDVFMISILTALVQAGNLASIIPGPGVICFCAVVILTMLAANSFDPRLMWDAAERPAVRRGRVAPAP